MARRHGYHRLWPEIAAALVVAVVFAVATFLASGALDARDGEEPTANLTGEETGVSLDQGPVAEGAVEDCLTPDFASAADQVDVVYAVQQVTAQGSVPVLLLRNGAGEVLLCDMFGADRPATVPQPVATPARPAVLFTNEDRVWECDTVGAGALTTGLWLSVTEPVVRAQLRFVVDGEVGGWFTSGASNGFVHLQAWHIEVPAGAEVQVELRVLDAEGEPVSSGSLPVGPQPAGDCGEGSTSIG